MSDARNRVMLFCQQTRNEAAACLRYEEHRKALNGYKKLRNRRIEKAFLSSIALSVVKLAKFANVELKIG